MSNGAEKTELYRHFDDEGVLLYVGISISALARFGDHRRNSPWFQQVSKITIERFETREAALAAEKLAIQAERPRYNSAHTGRRWVRLQPIDALQRYNVDEAAAYLGMSRLGVYAMMASGEIGAIRQGTRRYVPGSEIVRLGGVAYAPEPLSVRLRLRREARTAQRAPT